MLSNLTCFSDICGIPNLADFADSKNATAFVLQRLESAWTPEMKVAWNGLYPWLV